MADGRLTPQTVATVFVQFFEDPSQGKRRPVLIIKDYQGVYHAYKITTAFDNKSEMIQKQLFKMNDWQQAGLYKQSYIDVGRVVFFDNEDDIHPIGTLTDTDLARLVAFIKTYRERK